MTTTGMNLAEVRHLAEQLDHGAERLRSVVSTVDGRVTHSTAAGSGRRRTGSSTSGGRDIAR
jgi:hypothetical protein